MTIEGRPEIQYDWEASYRKQRRSRLDDALAEYLNDDTQTSPRESYEAILASAQEWIDYHKNNMDRWVEFKSLMMGNRPVDFTDSVYLTEDRITGQPVVKIGEDPVIFGA